MALKSGRMGRLVRPIPKFLDSWESNHLSKAAREKKLDFSIFMDTTGTLILAHCVNVKMVSKNILRWANITLNLDQLVILIYRILVIFARGLNNLPQFKIRVKIKGGLILRFILFSIYVRVRLWNTRLKCGLNSRVCKNHENTVSGFKRRTFIIATLSILALFYIYFYSSLALLFTI